MLRSEIIAALKDWELGFPVQIWRRHGLRVWPVVRIRLAFDMESSEQPRHFPVQRLVAFDILKMHGRTAKNNQRFAEIA